MTAPDEAALRERLGIPADAERVIVFAESSHWDPNWLLTSDEYFRLRVRRTLARALEVLRREPRRVFSVECVFFLRMFWDRCPELRDEVRARMAEGRLRLVGSGITTPDTLLPETEAILRDYLLGQEWLRAHGLPQEPRVAYLPDSFGHSPALPSILRALGVPYAAMTRIDGMFFPGADYRPVRDFPLPGSSAERLWREHRTADFVWRGPDGAEVLCHWNAFTYFQGDLLAHRGIARWMGLALGRRDGSGAGVARRIDRHVRQLGRLARTPYLFCPIGMDFNDPIPDLCALIDGYDREVYPETGVWAVNAALDDYLDLVACHREALPVLELDPNPYWMGFYAARPEVKQRARRLARRLVRIERLAALEGRDPASVRDALRPSWDAAAVANHHDLITGTSPDRVWRKEQRPELVRAEAALDAVTRGLEGERAARRAATGELSWRRSGERLEVETPLLSLVVDARCGGCITSLRDARTGEERLRGPTGDLVLVGETGGLWRLGHELPGGWFRERAAASGGRASVEAVERDGALEVRIRAQVGGVEFVRRLWVRADSAALRLSVEGAAPRRTSVLLRLRPSVAPRSVVTEVAGGVVERPLEKLYAPTFWPVERFAHLADADRPRGLAVWLEAPATLSVRDDGTTDCIVLRNAPWERAWGVVPVLAHPAWGTDDERHAVDLGFAPTGGNWRAAGVHRAAGDVLSDRPDLEARAGEGVRVDHPDVRVLAVKPAEDGDGWIVRLRSYAAGPVDLTVRRAGPPIREAARCDALERNGTAHEVRDGVVQLRMDAALASLRIR